MGISSAPNLGWLIALITFPGIMLHELAHKLCCHMARVPVYKTCYFRLGNPAGYVSHDPPDSYGKAFLIDNAPFVFNTIISVILYSIAIIIPLGLIAYILFWLGISIAMHSFPSTGDADNLWSASKESWKRNPLALLGFPIVGLIKLAAMARTIWFDLLYAIVLLVLVALLFKGNSPL